MSQDFSKGRRTFLESAVSAAIGLPAVAKAPWRRKPGFDRHVARVKYDETKPFPSDKRRPFGWPSFCVNSGVNQGQQAYLAFPSLNEAGTNLLFRITAGIDFREEKELTLLTGKTEEEIAGMPMRYAHPFQPFQVKIEEQWITRIKKQGIKLKLTKGETDAWFLLPGKNLTDGQGLQPQLLSNSEPGSEKDFLHTLFSLNAVSPFGWMGGCVHDGLLALGANGSGPALKTLESHLRYFINDKTGVQFEDPHTRPLDGTFNSLEDFLPFSAIVKVLPNHISVDRVLDFCAKARDERGLIAAREITTEGCYTLAYPLACIAAARNDQPLADLAAKQLLHRMQFLRTEGAIFQRATRDGEKGYRNWGRGVAWYLLGMIKTLRVLKRGNLISEPLRNELQQACLAACRMTALLQNEDGLWYAYIDQPATKTDASASAGIAAGLAWCYHEKIVDKSYYDRSRKAYQALLPLLTPDGFLTNITQINRGGEALQQNGYRVISQFGMGLLAQLKAALEWQP